MVCKHDLHNTTVQDENGVRTYDDVFIMVIDVLVHINH